MLCLVFVVRFLVLVFFSVGAGLQIDLLGDVWLASVCFALALVAVKPPVFALLLSKQAKQMREVSWEVGFRLGQASEFTLLLSFIALNYNMIGAAAGLVIQFATVLSLLVSSYLVIFRYPTPISPNPRLRRD